MLQTDLSLSYLYRLAKQQEGEKPTLLLLLHGYGSNEADLFSFAPELPEEFFIASVRAPRQIQYGGYGWYDINFMDAQKFNNVDQANESMKTIRTFIQEVIEKHDLNADEVWLCGFSQGSILSYALTLHDQQNIHRVICMSGYPAPDIMGDKVQSNFNDLEFFVSHGTEDGVIPVDWARNGEKLLKHLNIPHVYKEYRSGHGVVPQNFYDILAWIKEKM
ncbi:phospholipase [Weeksellaceae bacterium KMM 9724]|uniref:alpha/beta hydrolase n=1 Tax=Profundicola chukchiensis TaxID=2961959 RepID=UPI00243F499A|nr:phospholipase [Profundicola chukchiensis]MDG4950360.1 phospholipase [Profundicola chukchiensis]